MGFINRVSGAVGVDLVALRAAMKALGPTLLLDADLIAGSDGDAIGTWSDDSGNGYHFTQSDAAKKPLLKKAGNGINGHNVLRFDGSDDYMSSTATLANIMAASADTFWIVFKLMAVDTNSANIYYNDCAMKDINLVWGIYFKTDGKVYSHGDGGGTKVVSASISTSTPYTLRQRLASGNLYQRINANTEESVACSNYWNTTGSMWMGASFDICTQIDIAEVICFNSALSDLNMAIVDGYLKGKYGTY